jgi:hypothetical protein
MALGVFSAGLTDGNVTFLDLAEFRAAFAHFLPVHLDVWGRRDAQTHFLALYGYHGDLDFVSHKNRFPEPSRQDEHGSLHGCCAAPQGGTASE